MEVFDMLPVMNRNLWMPEEFNDFFDTDFMPRVSATAPAINVKESEKDYTVELAAPGLTKDDFNVNIDNDGNLHIKIENKSNKKDEDKKSHYLRREFSYSKYEQTLLLPDDVEKDKIAASVNHGVLTVELPKLVKAEEKTARQIEIK
ncbi:small heat shock protein [Prevotella sp. CAG:592]|jgi:HSP20 family protein|nr:small heat shock protein [Prevotella sp. CAG:592]